MKTLLVLITVCLLYPIIGYGQDIDHYKQLAEKETNMTAKLVAMDSVLSKSYMRDDDVFIDYSIRYIDLAKAIDSIEWAAKKAMNVQYTLTSKKNDPGKAIALINGVLAHKYKIKDSFLIGGLFLKRGGAHFRVDLEEAIEDYTLAIENFAETDSVYIADAYMFRGQANSTLGSFVKATEDFDTAYRYFEDLQDYQYMLHAQQGNIIMYGMNGFYEKAKEERDELIEKLIELGLTQYLATEYYNQSLDFKKMGDPVSQLESLIKARKSYSDSLRDTTTLLAIQSKFAEYYSTHDQLDLAEKYIDSIDEKYKRIKNDMFATLNYTSAKANYLKANNDYTGALRYARLKLENAKRLGSEDENLESYQLLSEIYAKMGDYKSSLDYKDKYIRIKDSLYDSSNVNSLAYYQTLLETEKKEKALVEKTSSLQLLEKDNESFKKVVAFSSVATILFFGLILLYRNRQELKYNKIRQERFSQELIVSQEEERKRISKDLHDSLGQQLLLIKNKVLATGDESTKKMVDNAIDEVRTISRDLHPFQLQEMGITKAIEHTLTKIDENTTVFISADIENIDNLFTPEQEVNIYRIVQESLNNIIKHAKAEASRVSVKKLADSITISIKDNGIGFDFSEKYQDVKSLGLKTLLERTKFLNGQMKVQSKINNGTTIEFQFPVS